MDNAAGNHTATTSTTSHALFDSKNGWFSYLFKCAEAKKVLKDQWAKMQGVIAGVDGTLDATAKMLEKAAEVNFTRWELLGTNMSSQPADIAKANTFKKQVNYLKDFLKARATALDAFYKTL
jgi:hypothetical protein